MTSSPITITSPAYYVSASGLDTNSGTESSPFLTLNKAQTAMQGGSTKTTYVMVGTYNLSQGITLQGNDSGESWLAYPRTNPVINGGGTVDIGFTIDGGAASIVINGLTFENFVNTGVDFVGDSITVTNNTFENLTSSDTNMGCVYAHYTLGGTTNISHNLCENNTGPGIGVGFGPSDPGITGPIIIDNNIVKNVNTNLSDTGGIYIDDRSHTLPSGSKITNNVINGYGSSPCSSTNGKAIYLDDNTSNETVSFNTISGCGEYGIQFHGGDHNVVTYNIFDISDTLKLGLYQDDPPYTIGGGGMAGNVVSDNIIYSSATAPSSLWDYIDTSVSISLPSVSNNEYYDTSGSLPNSGTIVDSNPIVSNPLFANASANNYTLSSTSPAYNSPIFFIIGSTSPGPHP